MERMYHYPIIYTLPSLCRDPWLISNLLDLASSTLLHERFENRPVLYWFCQGHLQQQGFHKIQCSWIKSWMMNIRKPLINWCILDDFAITMVTLADWYISEIIPHNVHGRYIPCMMHVYYTPMLSFMCTDCSMHILMSVYHYIFAPDRNIKSI